MSVVSELGIKDKWGTNLGDYQVQYDVGLLDMVAVSYTHLTLPTTARRCRSRWSPYH